MTLNAIWPTFAGVTIGKVRFVPPPAGAVNGLPFASSGLRPNVSRIDFSVPASMMSNERLPESSLSEALFTTTFRSALSPSRRKRGRYGRTIRSFTVFASLVAEPDLRSLVIACTQTFHDVTESGTENSIDADPSPPVTRCGCQNAVSLKSLRSWIGASGSPRASLPPAIPRVFAALSADTSATACAMAAGAFASFFASPVSSSAMRALAIRIGAGALGIAVAESIACPSPPPPPLK